MTPLFADAYFFIALLNPKDRAHQPAWSYIDPDLKRPLVTTTCVLLEVGDAMATTAQNRQAFLRLHRAIGTNPAVEIIRGDDRLDVGLDLYARRPDKAWSLTDCLSFVVMTDRGLTEALTGDHHFEQAGFQALSRP